MIGIIQGGAHMEWPPDYEEEEVEWMESRAFEEYLWESVLAEKPELGESDIPTLVDIISRLDEDLCIETGHYEEYRKAKQNPLCPVAWEVEGML